GRPPKHAAECVRLLSGLLPNARFRSWIQGGPDHGRDHPPSLHARNLRTDNQSRSRREVRAQDELALETARLETTVCLDDLIKGDPLSDARPDGAGCQQAEEPL